MPVSRAFLKLLGKVCISTRLAHLDSHKRKLSKIKNISLEQKVNHKRINAENKLLFGALLETQHERRKRISKNGDSNVSLSLVTAEEEKASNDKKTAKESKSKSAVSSSPKKTSTKSLKGKSTDSGKQEKKRSTKSKENYVLPASEKNLHSKESIVTACSSPMVSSPQISDELQNGLKRAQDDLADSGSSRFPLENASKAELLIESDREIIVGRNITKSDSFYKYPSVTRILSLTMSEASKSALHRWRSGLIAEMGEEKFQEFHANLLHLGSLFHSNLQEYLQLAPRNVSILDPELEGCWRSLEKVFSKISQVKLLESHVVHEELKYRGVIDCIALYRDMPLVIEWKKSNKPKYTLGMTYDAPLQLSAYIGALNYDSTYPFKVSKGLVVVAYSDGAPANVFPLSASELRLHWKAWMARYTKFTDMVHIETPKKEITPEAVV